MPRLKFSMQTRGVNELKKRMATASQRAKHALAIQMAKDTDPFVPARTKTLAKGTQVVDDTIIYPGPYARFLYYGKNLNISTAVHEKAQSHWFEASKAQNKEKWIRDAGRAVRRYL